MLEIRNLHVKFHSRCREAVSGVSLTIADGEILGLVGESGSGKSVTAMSVAGLLPRKQCDYSGDILLDGMDLLHTDRAALRKIQGRDIGVVFQEPQSSLDPLMKVGRQVEECLLLHTNLSKEERRARVMTAMTAVELPNPEALYDKYPHELSGGMLQRAMIAAAAVTHPKLLLLDEPTTALDVTIQAQVLELMRKLQAEYNTSLILITHDLGVVAKVCDKVAVVYAGEIIEYGTLEDIYTDKRHSYTVGLFESLPDIEKEAASLKVIPGVVPDPANLPKGCKFNPRCPEATDACRNEPIPFVKLSETHSVRCNRFGSAEV